jgi:hypothetical protein
MRLCDKHRAIFITERMVLPMAAYAEAYRQNEVSWLVFCSDCHGEIGTMTGETLLRAILNTANKGGVKCPDCRKISCARCGIRNDGCGPLNDSGICKYCEWEIAIEKERRETAIFVEVTLV